MSSSHWFWLFVTGLLLTTCLSLTAAYVWATSPKHASVSSARLPYSPNQVSTIEIVRLAFLLVIKSAVPGLAPALRRDETPSSKTYRLPSIEISGKLQLNDKQIELFRRTVLDEVSSDDVSSDDHINPLFLFAQVNPLVILLLAHKQCPIKPLGAVNTQNTFRFVHPQLCCDLSALQRLSRTGNLSCIARLGDEPGVRRKRGVEFSITIDVFNSGDLLVSMKMYFLQFLPSSFEPRYTPQSEDAPKDHSDLDTGNKVDQSISMTPADPKRWAASCKDYNPIHISRLGAKLFGGFARVIAHGNHVAALALQLCRQQRQDPSAGLWTDDRPVELSVRFLRPVTLPSELLCSWSSSAKGEQFLVRTSSNGKEALYGTVTQIR